MNTIVVVEYDPNWPTVFEQLRLAIWSAVSDLATSVEHVGSTSVPGLAAKPIIDISVVVPGADEVRVAIDRLAALGYVDRGNLGVDGRGSMPRHHLYLCPSESLALRNHLAVREHLRADPEIAKQVRQAQEAARRTVRR